MRNLDRPERKPDLQDLQPIDERWHSSRHRNRTDEKSGYGKKVGCKLACRATDPSTHCRVERPLQFEVGQQDGREEHGEQKVDGPIGHQGGGYGVHWRIATDGVENC